MEGDAVRGEEGARPRPRGAPAGGRAVVADGEAWGELWREHQDRYFAEHGWRRVDATAAHARRAHRAGADAQGGSGGRRTRGDAAQANEAAARDPEQVLAALTRNNATFTERDLDRLPRQALGAGPDGKPDAVRAGHRGTKAAVLGHAEVLPLHDRETGEAAGRFTTTDGARSRSGRRSRTRRLWPAPGITGASAHRRPEAALGIANAAAGSARSVRARGRRRAG